MGGESCGCLVSESTSSSSPFDTDVARVAIMELRSIISSGLLSMSVLENQDVMSVFGVLATPAFSIEACSLGHGDGRAVGL